MWRFRGEASLLLSNNCLYLNNFQHTSSYELATLSNSYEFLWDHVVFFKIFLRWIYLITRAHENPSPVLEFKIRLIGQSQDFSHLRPPWPPAEMFPECEKPCQPETFLRWPESRIGSTPSFLMRVASVIHKGQNYMKISLIHCSTSVGYIAVLRTTLGKDSYLAFGFDDTGCLLDWTLWKWGRW